MRRLIAILALVLALATPARADTSYYVDYGRTSNGSGTEASPWKSRTNIVWATIETALASGNVTIYFSSRATWTDNQLLQIPVGTNETTNRLTLDGQSKYNLTATGTAVWADETVASNRAVSSGTGGTTGSFYILNDNQYVTIRGFYFLNPTWAGINIGSANPTIDISNIVIENNIIDTPVNLHGIWFGYAETGCSDITIRNNVISNTDSEAIYMGHFNYMDPTITGVVIEYNTVINTGIVGEGDIDIKPGVAGAIVRYNTIYGTGTGRVQAGIVVLASDVQVYGNTIYDVVRHPSTGGGDGITVNADGDGAGTGQTLANVLVYNNLIYGTDQRGISVFADVAGATITDLKILNNTIVGSGSVGFRASASGGRTIGIAQFANNLIADSGTYAMELTSGVTLSAADHNLYDGVGTLFRYQSADKSWAQWQGLGFDASGLNTDPVLTAAYLPTDSSPVRNAGSVETEFAIDQSGQLRGGSWDIGAFEWAGTAMRTRVANPCQVSAYWCYLSRHGARR